MASFAVFLRRLSLPVMFFVMMLTSGQAVLDRNTAAESLGCNESVGIEPVTTTTSIPATAAVRTTSASPTSYNFLYSTSSSPYRVAAEESTRTSQWSDESASVGVASVSMPEEIEELVNSLQARQAMKYSSSRRIRGDTRPGQESTDIFDILKVIEAREGVEGLGVKN
ncbi:hypothetical protein FOL47_002702 [Perkinsus chesapeaki]|uniref:Uncharacterized protein n=1 Tax=Perkinsus chesapeaki TaxID=330153 RepID=A0A7J6MC58_PERCH|nr:hypothetical protein FOL47_002702 [Perkinsus chesapeaki]